MSDILKMLGLNQRPDKKEGNGLLIIYLKSGHTLNIKGKATIERSKRDINTVEITTDTGDYEFPVTSVIASFNDWK